MPGSVSNALSISPTISGPIAFILSGLFSVRVTMLPVWSTRMVL